MSSFINEMKIKMNAYLKSPIETLTNHFDSSYIQQCFNNSFYLIFLLKVLFVNTAI